MIKTILICVPIFWLIFYGCIYISILTFTIATILRLKPVYTISNVIETEYDHVYVMVKGYPLFLSPFKEYSKPTHYFYTTKEMINYAPNMWNLNLRYRK